MADKKSLNDNVNSGCALRDAAEDQLGKSTGLSPELKDQTPEEIIHELRVHQIELEIQNAELQRMQLALEQSKGKYQNLYDFAPVGYFTLTHKGIISEANLAGAALLGMPRPKLIGRGFGHFIGPESLAQWDQHILGVLGQEEKQNCDLTLRREDGSSFYARLESIRMHAPAELPELSEGTYVVSIAVIDVSERKRADLALRESEERYRTVADFTYGWEYWVDSEGNFLYVSPSCERITGYSAKEFIDDPDLMNRIIHPDDRTVMLDHFYRVRKATPHALDAMDFRIIRRDGATRWISHVCQPVFAQEGQTSGRRGSNRDITERKIAEESLKEAGAFLNTLLNAIPVPLFYKDKEGRYIGCNKSYEEFYGKTQQELVGKSVFDIAPRDLAEIYHAKDIELFHNPGAQVYDSQIADARGAVHDVVFHKSTFADSQGHVLGLIGVILDITERRMAEEVQKLLFAAIENAADGVIITDTTGIIQYVNPAQEILSGYSRDELLGKTSNIFKSDKHDDNFYSQLWDTIKAGNVWHGKFINKKRDGTEYHEDATISPIYDHSGNLTNFVAVKHDVTIQLTLQEQLFQAQKMEAIGTLAGGFAHDFNNKLQVIDGYVELILFNKDLPTSVISGLGVIKQTIHSSAELIKGMMVFARKAPVDLKPIELNKLVAQTRSMLIRCMPKMIGIDLLLADDLWAINAAPNQIDQILMNLAVNARDAMPDGGKLTIQTHNIVMDEDYCRVHPNTKPGRYALITISDTGTGMDEQTASRIFEPFFTTKAPGKGTGLGLSVVYGIVEQHNGWIICDSALSVGTTFRIYFPAIEEVPQEQYFEKKEPPMGQGETILLVDDEPDFLEITSHLLNRTNYRVITAIHGKDALELYEKHREEIRLVILDVLMPGMGGQECLGALLRMDPNSRVLMVSGYNEKGRAEEIEAAGAKGLMWKPFDMPELLEKIREIIDGE